MILKRNFTSGIVLLVLLLLTMSVIAETTERDLQATKSSKGEGADKIKGLRKDIQERYNKLDDAERGKLNRLREQQLENLGKIKDERLKKITTLQDEQLKRVSEIKANNIRKLTILNQENLNKITSLDSRFLEKAANLDRARLNEIANLPLPEIRKKLARIEIKPISAELGFKERIISKEDTENAKKLIKEYTDKIAKTKEDIKSDKDSLDSAKAENNEEKIVEHIKNYLVAIADKVIIRLEQLKERVKSSDKLSEQEAKKIIEDIELKIKELNDAKALVENAKTRAELKENGKLIVNAWSKVKHAINRHKLALEDAHINAIIKRSAHLENRLERILKHIEEKDIQIDKIDAIVTSFSEKINSARQLYESAKESFIQAKEIRDESSEKARELVQKSRENLKEAQQRLKEAHDILVDIVKEIKAIQDGEESVAELEATTLEQNAEVAS